MSYENHNLCKQELDFDLSLKNSDRNMNADDPQLCGTAEIADGRWILWSLEWSISSSHCVLTLNEKWFSKDLPNGFVRISFDGKN
jgi:hypothetical protein